MEQPFLLTKYDDISISRQKHNPPSLNVPGEALCLIPLRCWKEAEGGIHVSEGVFYEAERSEVSLSEELMNVDGLESKQLSICLRTSSKGGEEGVFGDQALALVSEPALKWDYVNKGGNLADGKCTLDIFTLRIRVLYGEETNTLVVKIEGKENETEAFNCASKIFCSNSGMLQIWDFSGQTNQLFLDDMKQFKDSDQSYEIIKELIIYGLSCPLKEEKRGKEDMVVEHHSAVDGPTSISSNVANVYIDKVNFPSARNSGCKENEVSLIFNKTMAKLLRVTHDAGKSPSYSMQNSSQADYVLERVQLLNLCVSFLPCLDTKEIDILYVAIRAAVQDSEGLIQKTAYEALAQILEFSDNFVSRKAEEVLSLMLEMLPYIHFSAKLHSLYCLYTLTIHVSKVNHDGDMLPLHIIDDIVHSLWSILPSSSCNNTVNTSESLNSLEGLEKKLDTALQEQSDDRGILRSSLQVLRQQKKRIVEGTQNNIKLKEWDKWERLLYIIRTCTTIIGLKTDAYVIVGVDGLARLGRNYQHNFLKLRKVLDIGLYIAFSGRGSAFDAICNAVHETYNDDPPHHIDVIIDFIKQMLRSNENIQGTIILAGKVGRVDLELIMIDGWGVDDIKTWRRLPYVKGGSGSAHVRRPSDADLEGYDVNSHMGIVLEQLDKAAEADDNTGGKFLIVAITFEGLIIREVWAPNDIGEYERVYTHSVPVTDDFDYIGPWN